MAFSLFLDKAQNNLQIATNGLNPNNVYREVLAYLDTKIQARKGQQVTDYSWTLDADLFEEWYQKYDNITTYAQPLDYIRGTDTRVFPTITPQAQFIKENHVEPYPFQVDGINFLIGIKRGIIGDEMGLGKTLQTMYAAVDLIKQGHAKKVLIVSPSAVKYQWQGEIVKFAGLDSLVVDGTKAKRAKVYTEFFNAANPTPFLIANYETIRTDIETVAPLVDEFVDVVIADEAHRMKNRESKLFAAMMQLNSEYRFAATGTPMQNNPEELYALMEWINPEILGSLQEFRRKYIVYGEKFGRQLALGYRNLDELRNQVAPVMLRRMKKDVAKDLPEIINKDIYVEMDKNQAALYKQVTKDATYAQDEFQTAMETYNRQKTGDAPSDAIMLGYQYLEQAISDDPQLLLNSDSSLASRYIKLAEAAKKSAKVEELIEVMRDFLASDSRIVVFTQYVQMVDILKERFMTEFKQEPFVIDGRVAAQDRTKQLEESKTTAHSRDILLMSDAGNYGLNAQQFDVLINFDLSWNPAIMQQRTGRIHRIGSENEQVTIINMLTRDTIDENIMKMLHEKATIGDAIV
ncbi:DEAD/DEAH box helicase [Periweissella cryptocerci]|uniref:DEAD/DEAH box helicase n=1 Tax=Periweissella cryptocerci TaxID=2506420 RepID=A0A4P6YR56_9LACO|nr:DEAD/DEAH box helicase [Periweissella cryptocerci]QBO35100.1 DEAD/DEAH box helicase [Periweissella cryptocerci]